MNVIVASKQPELQWLDLDAAIKYCTAGLGIWSWASNDKDGEPDVVMVCCRGVPTLKTLAALDILLVDDNQDGAEALKILLELRGHRVRLVLNGAAALQAVEEQLPDLMLLDIGLPNLNGYEVADQIRSDQNNAGICLVALTGFGQAADRARTKLAGFNDHMVKPPDLAALDRIIRDQTRSSQVTI